MKQVLPDDGLLMDMLNHPGLNCRSPHCIGDRFNSAVPFFIYAMHDEDVFSTLIANGKVDFDVITQPHGYSLLHLAVHKVITRYFVNLSQSILQNLHSTIGKLLAKMSIEQINRTTVNGMKAYSAQPSNVSQIFSLVKLFVDCPKVRIGAL